MLALEHSAAEELAILLTAFATLLASVGGFIVLAHRQGRTHSTVERVYDTVNSVQDEEQVPVNGDGEEVPRRTLGQTVRIMHDEVRAGFDRNAEEHLVIRREVTEGLHQVGERLDVHRDSLDAQGKRLDKLERGTTRRGRGTTEDERRRPNPDPDR